MNSDVIQLTKEGMEELRAELKQLVEEEKPDILRRLAEARAHGDLSENAEYHAAKERKAMIILRSQELSDVLIRAEVFEPTEAEGKGRCIFGSFVTVDSENQSQTKRKFQLVNSIESSTETDKLSITSPLGHALLGKKVGDVVEINVPAGIIEYEVVAVSYPG